MGKRNDKLPIGHRKVAVSTRIRLARDFADYPFPNRLLKDAHAEEQAYEIIRLVAARLSLIDDFKEYVMRDTSEETAAYLKEKSLISRDLLAHRRISAAFVSKDESVSVMVNEEDHIREQYFVNEFAVDRAYERICGIDDAISECLGFAYDGQLGYLTACPTNLGTGLRASVMLFLPALSHKGILEEIAPDLRGKGLAVRGFSGEGSRGEGELFQISNEITLGVSEESILENVVKEVSDLIEFELSERVRYKRQGGVRLHDQIMRSFGILSNSCLLGETEFSSRLADVKLGAALEYLPAKAGAGEDGIEMLMEELDNLRVEMRPANLNRLNGAPLGAEEQDAFRADFTSKKLHALFK